MTSARIRMYNVGFGDCFLVTLHTSAGDRTILVDCGVHPFGHGPFPIRAVAESIVDALPRDPKRLDVVVASHRHADHIAGFDEATWQDVEVGEVWLPWTEDRSDPDAAKIRAAQQKLAMALAKVQLRGNVDKRVLADLTGLDATNKQATGTLLDGFAGKPARRFLPNKTGSATFETAVLPGVRVHVLGPTRDAAIIADMDPPDGQSYLALAERGEDAPPADLFPGMGHPVDSRLSKPYHGVVRAAELDAIEVAVSLADAVNGTSLLLAIEVDSQVLLFPGDAQWGTWRAAMELPEWQSLLRRATFLKLGHHGSHNATPVRFVEEFLPEGIAAMCSTRHMDRWPRIPRKPLLDRLQEKGVTVVRSDRINKASAPFVRGPDDRWVEIEL